MICPTCKACGTECVVGGEATTHYYYCPKCEEPRDFDGSRGRWANHWKCSCKPDVFVANINEPIELNEDGFAVNGCCGGGCFVIRGMLFCPFCGNRIFELAEVEKT